MNKLILSLLLLTTILSCQNENDGTKNNSTSNDKSSDENQAKILKEKEEQRIKDSIELVEEERKEIESYTGTYHIPPPTGPGTGVCEVYIYVKKGEIVAEQTCGMHVEPWGRTSAEKILFKTDLKLNKKYKLSQLFDVSGGHAFGCEYFEFKDHKLFLYDDKLKVVNDWFCCLLYGGISDIENKCDCIIPKSN